MDYRRYLLIASIAILTYTLLINWGSFQDKKKQQQLATAQSMESSIQSNIVDATDNMELTNNNAMPTNEELPSQTAGAVPVATEPTLSAVKSSNYITVTTDSLNIKIDPNGGDIVFASLPKHAANIETPEIPFTLLDESSRLLYVAQSGLIGVNGIDTAKGRPEYKTGASSYQLQEGQDELLVDLHYPQDNGISITKRFTFKRGDYLINISYLINNRSSASWSGGMFGQLKRDNSKDPGSDSGGFGMAPFLGAAYSSEEEPFKKLKYKDFAEKPLRTTEQGKWIAMIQHYFLSAWIPNPKVPVNFSTAQTRSGLNIIRFTSPAIQVAPGEQGEVSAQLYVGPKDQYRLEEISENLDLSVDYGWLWWIAQPLFWILNKLYSVLGNWGFAIIGITILVKIAFFQLNAKAYKSMANMRKFQPKMMEIRDRYKEDRQKQSQEMMKLYQKEGINPLGGCLPILVQMPVFLALYWVLMESVELRHAPFIGYIKDLSAMDPYYILPLCMGVSMFLQQKLNPPPTDPMQAKVMQWMPVIFTFFFLFFPAGLVLYWVVNNTLSIIQQYIITKKIEQGE